MADPTRRVFFSFHYQRDIWRAQQIKNHWVTKDSKVAAGFFDGSLEEKAKKEGDLSVKRLINQGLHGASVTCVLVGEETYQRRWVDYEIFKSIEVGMGVFGVRIHQLRDRQTQQDNPGGNPFTYLGYGTRENSDKMWPMINYSTGWKDAPLNDAIYETSAPYLIKKDLPILNSLFPVYDWVGDNGYDNFGYWVINAANHAGR